MLNWFKNKASDTEREQPNSVRPTNTDMRSELGLQSDGQSAVRIRTNKASSVTSGMHPETAAVYDEDVRLHDLKVRARRRLIGAAVLLTAAFIILPWVFDEQRKQTASQVAVVVPDKNMQFDVKNPRATDESVRASADKVAAKPTSPNDLLYPAQPNGTASTANGAAQVTPPKPTTSSTAPAAKPAETTPPATTKKPTQKFAVHIGLLSDQKELETLLAKLRSAGVEPQLKTVVVDGVSKTRVRLGLFDTQAQAAVAAAKAKGVAKNPVVIPITPEQ